jgi:uncharacterized protein (TIGR00255 family)
MTGFGQSEVELSRHRAGITLRGVNNRFADVRMRVPSELGPVEGELRRRITSRVRRGRVELSIRLQPLDGGETRVTVNRPLVEKLVGAAPELRDRYGLEGDLDLPTLLSLPGVLRAEPDEAEWPEEDRRALERGLDAALDALDRQRVSEGANLCRDLLERIDAMETLVGNLRQRAADQPERIRERLQERLAALAVERDLDPARVAQEAIMLADRADVTEELVRLSSHLDQARRVLAEPDGDPVGKRLDFLLQEIHRETNTLGSKSADLELTRGALTLKLEAEKIREQVQNVE